MTRLLTAAVEDGRLRDPEADSPSVPWWSLTKTALAAAALVLVAGGSLALDRPLAGRPFTLRQLLQHTAGVPDYGGLRDYHEAVARGDAPWSAERLLRSVDAERLLFPPGEGWAYSNVGYLLVRHLVEQAATEDIDAALRRLVFAPLGLAGVRLAREPADLAATAWGNAAGYGLGLMIDVASSRGRCLGHTGQGPGSTSAAYHFPDLDPPATAAAFAPVEDQAVVEFAVMGTWSC